MFHFVWRARGIVYLVSCIDSFEGWGAQDLSLEGLGSDSGSCTTTKIRIYELVGQDA